MVTNPACVPGGGLYGFRARLEGSLVVVLLVGRTPCTSTWFQGPWELSFPPLDSMVFRAAEVLHIWPDPLL